MIKILDIQRSITAANGNVSLAKDLFTMLLDDLDIRQQQIENSFQADDMVMLEEHIHKLYGATAYCIVPKLRQSTEILEGLLRQKDYSQLKKFVEQVLQEIQLLISNGPDYIEQNWLEFQTTN
ncbi:MAG: Hpt domain-containing protein [Gammaproteobacteria bacterium]|nr:Hpt domain-containing protein [Gammaproteobacteria bacterium]